MQDSEVTEQGAPRWEEDDGEDEPTRYYGRQDSGYDPAEDATACFEPPPELVREARRARSRSGVPPAPSRAASVHPASVHPASVHPASVHPASVHPSATLHSVELSDALKHDRALSESDLVEIHPSLREPNSLVRPSAPPSSGIQRREQLSWPRFVACIGLSVFLAQPEVRAFVSGLFAQIFGAG